MRPHLIKEWEQTERRKMRAKRERERKRELENERERERERKRERKREKETERETERVILCFSRFFSFFSLWFFFFFAISKLSSSFLFYLLTDNDLYNLTITYHTHCTYIVLIGACAKKECWWKYFQNKGIHQYSGKSNKTIIK